MTELKGGPTASGDHGGGAKPAASAAASAATGAGSKKKGGGGRGGGRGGKGGRSGRGGRGKKRGGGSGDDSDPDYMEGTTASAAEEQEDADLAAAMAASLADAAPGAAAAGAAAAAEAAGGAAAEGEGAAEIVSSNAYLLVYRRRGEALPLVPLDTEQEAALAAARESLESEQQQAVASYAEAKQRLVERQATRQSEVRTVMEAAARLEDGAGVVGGWAETSLAHMTCFTNFAPRCSWCGFVSWLLSMQASLPLNLVTTSVCILPNFLLASSFVQVTWAALCRWPGWTAGPMGVWRRLPIRWTTPSCCAPTTSWTQPKCQVSWGRAQPVLGHGGRQ